MSYHWGVGGCVCGGGVCGVCVCIFLGIQPGTQSPTRIGLILVLEGIVFHYNRLKCLFGTVTIYFDILF